MNYNLLVGCFTIFPLCIFIGLSIGVLITYIIFKTIFKEPKSIKGKVFCEDCIYRERFECRLAGGKEYEHDKCINPLLVEKNRTKDNPIHRGYEYKTHPRCIEVNKKNNCFFHSLKNVVNEEV